MNRKGIGGYITEELEFNATSKRGELGYVIEGC